VVKITQEVIAAALIVMENWNKQDELHDVSVKNQSNINIILNNIDGVYT
jgi:hypothetical protein